MFRRVLLLSLIVAIPVLTALATQRLAASTLPPSLPSQPVAVVTQEGSSAPPEAPESGDDEDEDEDDDDPAGAGADSEASVESVELETDLDGAQDDGPESGRITR